MKIIELNATEYRNYANIHSSRNFGQSVEYSMLEFNNNKSRIFLGLIDDMHNIHAAVLLLIHNVSPYAKEAVAPNGYLIDYTDYELVSEFTNELKNYLLKEEKVTYLITNPMFKYKVYNRNNMVIVNNQGLLSNLYNLEYTSIGYYSDFERFDVIIENNNGIEDIYNNFTRTTKRNIKEAINFGITLHKGSYKDLEEAYNIFKKKTKKKLAYYQNLMQIYNSKDNKMEVFFAKLNPHKYLVNVQRLYEEERINNEKIHDKTNYNRGHINERLMNKRINSDNALERLKIELNRAIVLNQKYDTDIIVGTALLIRNNHEIYFLIDGYNEEYRAIHSTHILKWAIIKKYYSLGYRVFNLGEIHKNYADVNSKYYGQYKNKMGFGGNVIEYTPNLLLVINKPIYTIYSKLKRMKH